MKRKSKRTLLPRSQIREQPGRQKYLRSLKQEAFLLDSYARWNREQELHEAVVDKNRPHFNAVSHAHCVEVAQQTRLQMRMNVHEREALAEVFFFHLLRPVR